MALVTRGAVVLGLLALAGCAARLPAMPPLVARSGDTLLVQGPIDSDTASRFLAAMAQPGVTTVQLRSPGGDVASALDMAERMRDAGVDVEVLGPCLSSCANYLFPAGRRKLIRSGGVVAWHGNARHLLMLQAKGRAEITPEALPSLQELAAREQAFFRSVGVDESVCWFGKEPPFDVLNSYFLSATAMALFGLRGVEAPLDYEATDTALYLTLFGRELVLLDIADMPPGSPAFAR